MIGPKQALTLVNARIFEDFFNPTIMSFIIRFIWWQGLRQLRIQGQNAQIVAQQLLTFAAVSDTTIENRLTANLQLIQKTLSSCVFPVFLMVAVWLPAALWQQPKKDVIPFWTGVALVVLATN